MRQAGTEEHNESINSEDYLENSFEEDLHQYGEEPKTYKGNEIIGQPTAIAAIIGASSPRESPTGSPNIGLKFANRDKALAETVAQQEAQLKEETRKLQDKEMVVAELAAAKKVTKEKKEKKKRKKAKKPTEGEAEAGQAALNESLDWSHDDMVEQYGNDLEDYEMEPGARRPRPMAKDLQQAVREEQQLEMEGQSEDALSVDISMELAEGPHREKKKKKKKKVKDAQQESGNLYQEEMGGQSEDALSVDISMEVDESAQKEKKKRRKKKKTATEDAQRVLGGDQHQLEVG